MKIHVSALVFLLYIKIFPGQKKTHTMFLLTIIIFKFIIILMEFTDFLLLLFRLNILKLLLFLCLLGTSINNN